MTPDEVLMEMYADAQERHKQSQIKVREVLNLMLKAGLAREIEEQCGGDYSIIIVGPKTKLCMIYEFEFEDEEICYYNADGDLVEDEDGEIFWWLV